MASSLASTTGDPLSERMTSILRLSSRPSPSQQRERRFSDADRPRPTSEQFDLPLNPVPTMSKDFFRQQDGRADGTTSTLPDSALRTSIRSPPLQQHNCTAAECAVIKVFHTMELIELIFSFLEYRDIHSLRNINRHCNYTVKESKQLRIQFFSSGQWRRPGAQFQLLPLSLPGVTIEAGEELHLGQWIEVSFTPEAARRISPWPNPTKRVRSRSIFEGLRGGLGNKAQNDPWPASNSTSAIDETLQYEDLLISQPPTVGMHAFVIGPRTTSTTAEDMSTESETPACAKLSSDTGITLGFLAETAHSFLARNDGPSEPEDVKVVFKAIMSFSEPDQTARKRTGKRTVFYI